MTRIKAKGWIKKLWESDQFYCPGRINPKEYNWKEQFHQLAVDAWEMGEPFTLLDVGKVLGLATYIEELEAIIDEYKKNELMSRS